MAPKKAVASEEAPPSPPPPAVEHKCGELKLPSGSVYVGEYRTVDGVKEYHGKGTLAQGCEFLEGEWNEGDLLHGRYAFQSGASYEGQFYHNAFHGQGIYTWPEGKTYEGTFANGAMDGWGRLTLKTLPQAAQMSTFEGVFTQGAYDSNYDRQQSLQGDFEESYTSTWGGSALQALQRINDALTQGQPIDGFLLPNPPAEGEGADEPHPQGDHSTAVFAPPYPTQESLRADGVAALCSSPEEEREIHVLRAKDDATHTSASQIRAKQFVGCGQVVEISVPSKNTHVALANCNTRRPLPDVAEWRVVSFFCEMPEQAAGAPKKKK
ncbi:unnamed protein product [Vitrella brassicaformis CCMP3155]|uniref:MORN repeat-containing protein 5 n=1 Tax=Vitrella brassicaformis (strain CCMP3155) TaxID=1169540 RepID=A0A0G4GG45_VITBC|nr:unnamed protein product [Vitrella brassicaformis CCMP3155]|eukprot:CEM28591.1 unnamed protein product [Vitrella brassicaformis CCMP3155]